MHDRMGSDQFLKARNSAGRLGLSLRLDPETRQIIERELTDLEADEARTSDELVDVLDDAAKSAMHELEAGLPRWLTAKMPPVFGELKRFVERRGKPDRSS
jgi:hypothetical protein